MNDEDKILIVEDEEDARYILTHLLRRNNYNVKEANNGLEALDLIEEFKPKIILADWNMPKMNGVELCNRIKSNPDLKIIYFIVLTARASLRDRVQGLDIGADDFLVKPVDNQELLARIRTGLRIYNLQNELKVIEHNKALRELTVTIGHKINNPLSSLLLAFQGVTNQLNEEQKEKFNDEIEIINESISRIEKIVEVLKELKTPELVQYVMNNRMLKID
ncbi:MAG: response regulator [Melioribacteraceae bacterium]|nr:response regulator [Melioribacteraceae bacterium]MCF8355169.1 response regulator [Melioribacteraceae bacterium]MCF8392498.1 response regulator [Melioribacteraceae bacterium]MCF8418409.1 response regulator [Melioribacteraceae bacterium]